MSTKSSSKGGLSTRDKGMIVFFVLAVLFAGGFIYKTWSQDQGHAAAKVTIPMDAMPKGAWIKAHKAGQNASDVPENGGEGVSLPGSNTNSSSSGQ